ncbi:MAG: hypothetical protein WBA71_05230 [Candidatus Humimicrobiia bacterium]
MDWIQIISLMGSFIIAGMTIYFNYKARTSPYREALYSKQLEGYVELANAIIEATREGIRCLSAGGSKTKKGKVLYSQITGKITNIHFEYSKWAILLPREISSLVINFDKEIERIFDLPFNKEENSELIVNAHIKILNEIRKIMRTEPLSKETLKLIEKIKS